jgi:DNA repair protein RecN (Recombination protein N)
MFAGMESTDTGRAHAEELLALADADKKAVDEAKPARGGKKKVSDTARKRAK